MPPDFWAQLSNNFWMVLQAGTATAAAYGAKWLKELQATKKKEAAERRAQDAVILQRLEALSNQQSEVKEEVKNTHSTNLRHDLDIAIKSSQEARDNSTQALKVAEQIRDSVESLAGDFRESKKEHVDFRERHNRSAEDIQDLNKRVNALFSTVNKENNHE